ncbi:TPA: hypothetical protein MYU56_003981 [Klebsiella pneumoniae]|uniref:hypothetical protein n=1 Tax=Klebsiella pneumoniae TaxID=573 RepID=UPI000CB50F9F|nr:hypothetical protein [Klebsiella pneumoniae]HDS9341378.1 hypothetical protein [Klebsiella pneumoniae subsp. pneumoniae]AXO54208.1 hypothetical protein AXA58_05305 [Klebsiella pneumoniae]EJC6248614.1 hypothetical protein [Klebsiella pneumoniae]EKZ5685696.1 hypothetical protein [Klebsiella pneumoniae]MBL9532199.1 hypothetical protein [Klebsiella pneumoniae]
MNISTVNELIASLESAGELSIREQKFLKLAKAYQQLAAENVALKNAITDHSHSVHFCEVCGKDDPCSTDDVCYALKDIPDTDRIVAGIKADAIDEAAVELDRVDTVASTRVIGFKLREFSQQLREGADK